MMRGRTSLRDSQDSQNASPDGSDEDSARSPSDEQKSPTAVVSRGRKGNHHHHQASVADDEDDDAMEIAA